MNIKNNKGFSILFISLIVLIVLIISGGTYYYLQNKEKNKKESSVPVGDSVSTSPSMNDNSMESDITQNCATPEMFESGRSKVLEAFSPEELKNLSPNFRIGNLTFNSNKGDLTHLLMDGRVLNLLRPGVSGDQVGTITYAYEIKGVDCVTAVEKHQIDSVGGKIKTIYVNKSGLTIYEKPGCCTGYNPEVHFFVEVPSELRDSITNSSFKYYEITPFSVNRNFYEPKDLENVFRSLRFIKD